jgi:D-galactarolactone cycloisomerase
MDPFEEESLADRSYTELSHFDGSVFVRSALSAIYVACWDIIGKELGRPVHQILGGQTKEALTTYASTMYFTERERPIAEPVEEAAATGFEAAKIKIGTGVKEDIERVRIAREVLGEDARLMVDYNGNYRPDQAIQSAKALAEFDLTWLAEPVPPGNLDGYREVREHVDTPIAAGEAHYGRFAFKQLIDERLVDIVQPNLGRCGGFSEARRIASLASAANVGVRPHVWNSAVGLAAAVQFAASVSEYPHTGHVPDPMMVEFDRSPNPLRSELLAEPFDLSGAR